MSFRDGCVVAASPVDKLRKAHANPPWANAPCPPGDPAPPLSLMDVSSNSIVGVSALARVPGARQGSSPVIALTLRADWTL